MVSSPKDRLRSDRHPVDPNRRIFGQLHPTQVDDFGPKDLGLNGSVGIDEIGSGEHIAIRTAIGRNDPSIAERLVHLALP
ncbi:MAG: hypothetical protein CL927_08325 [Deltaproteobacteria bacterium]|nr:hypothetical protein [Deltaproteobacteria bacterium]